MNRELDESDTLYGAVRRLHKQLVPIGKILLRDSQDMNRNARQLPAWRCDKYLRILASWYIRGFAVWLGGDA